MIMVTVMKMKKSAYCQYREGVVGLNNELTQAHGEKHDMYLSPILLCESFESTI